MEAVWYALVAFMLTVYVVLDGFDLGVGIVHCFVARNDVERRTVFAAIGPVWDGNEVWLIASGGTLVFAFPRAYAVGFSGFYLPLMMTLWCLILRGVAIEFRSQHANPLWRAFQDAIFSGASTALALVLGVALGNVIRGVPIDDSGYFRGPLFTDFRVGPNPGALDAYSLSIGAFAVLALAAHGANYLAWKTDGELGERAARLAAKLWIAVVLALVVATAATALVDRLLFARMFHRPWFWPLPVASVASVFAVFIAHRRRLELAAFLGSAAFLASLLGAAAAAEFPYLLQSTRAAVYSLTAYNSATVHRGLALGLAWWVPALLLALGYFVFAYRSFKGKVHADDGH